MKYRLLFMGLYGLAGGVALELAFALRFYFDPLPFQYDEMLLQMLPVAIVCKVLAADICGLTRSLWRYGSFRDLKSVGSAGVLGSLLFVPLTYLLIGPRFPNGPLLLDLLLTLMLFTLIRYSGRFWMEARRLFESNGKKAVARVLILGAGERGELALRFLRQGGLFQNKVIGFLDEDPDNVGRRLLGFPVLGGLKELPKWLRRKEVDEVVIALDHPSAELLRVVFAAGSATGARISLMPELSSGSGRDSLQNPIRELRMSDFLGREAVQLDPAPLRKSLGGKRVLVTGAGGSIGSELCRQIARLPVESLLLLDFSETALFEISEELRGGQGAGGGEQGAGSRDVAPQPPTSDLRPPLAAGASFGQAASGLRSPIEVLLCDIRNEADVAEVFALHQPEVVFHAAAYKHVPMMEKHPLEAARTNVLGTRNVVRVAEASGVRRFLHVSTDKVVEAEGVMGGSKAWGERIVRAAGYNCVRFGNVLGSSGSVIPLFEKQWQREGQLQVTHRKATRYFMTIEEAVLLMLHAEALQGRGDVYILDMGEPVKIFDLAKQMLALKEGGGQKVGYGRQETGDRRQETGDRRQETGYGRQETGYGRQETGYGRQETGDVSGTRPPFPGPRSPAPDLRPPASDLSTEPGIRIVGLRPGERIHERLHTEAEKLESTPVPKVNKLSGRFERSGLEEYLEKLEQAVADRKGEEIREMLLSSVGPSAGGG